MLRQQNLNRALREFVAPMVEKSEVPVGPHTLPYGPGFSPPGDAVVYLPIMACWTTWEGNLIVPPAWHLVEDWYLSGWCSSAPIRAAHPIACCGTLSVTRMMSPSRRLARPCMSQASVLAPSPQQITSRSRCSHCGTHSKKRIAVRPTWPRCGATRAATKTACACYERSSMLQSGRELSPDMAANRASRMWPSKLLMAIEPTRKPPSARSCPPRRILP